MPGRDGVAGSAGRDGERGRDGVAGRDGLPGRDGKDGRDGTSLLSYVHVPSPTQIFFGRQADGSCEKLGGAQVPCAAAKEHGWLDLFLAIVGGIGAFVTACTPVLLGLAKLRYNQKQVQTGGSGAALESPKISSDLASELAPESGRPILDVKLSYVLTVIVFGGLFFAYLLVTFATALLAFIIAFMLSSGALLLALAYTYKLIGESDMSRQLYALKIARLEAKLKNRKSDPA